MSKFDEILSRLQVLGGSKKLSDGTWMCRCPSHKDKSASLGVREDHDGKVIMNCLAGCSKPEILDAMGLTWADLFPDKDYKPRRDGRPSVNIREVSDQLLVEAMTLYQYYKDMEKGEIINVDGFLNCGKAISNIQTLLEGRNERK